MDIGDKSDAHAGWIKSLNPQTLRSNLMIASIYLVTWQDDVINEPCPSVLSSSQQHGLIINK